MKEAFLNKKSLLNLLNNLRIQDKLEMDEVFKKSSLDDFFQVCFDKKNITYFLTTDEDEPLALGGAYCIDDNIARVWLLITNEADNYKLSLYKYIKNKIVDFKVKFAFLYNFIFESNFSSLSWLQKCGFAVMDLKCDDYKLFYFNRGDLNIDLRHITCK